MTKWQTSRLVLTWILFTMGLLFFASFSYFGYSYIFPAGESYKQGHDLVVWMSLIYSFSFFVAAASLAYTLRKVVSNKLVKVLFAPALLSGAFVVSIPLAQLM